MTKEEKVRAKLDSAIAKLMDEIELNELPILGACLLELGSALKKEVVKEANKHGIVAVAGVDIPKEG